MSVVESWCVGDGEGKGSSAFRVSVRAELGFDTDALAVGTSGCWCQW